MTVKMFTTPRTIVKEVLTDSEEEISDSIEMDNAENARDNKEVNSAVEHHDEYDYTEETDEEINGEFDNNGDESVNTGWADSIAKILKTNKPKKKKTLVLSKAVKLTDVRKQKPKSAGFEVEKPDGEIREEKIDTEIVKEVKEVSIRKKKKEILSVRMKPNILEKDRERVLSKIATKGVVQLFNAVKQQQKDIKTKLDQAGPLEVKRDRVFKSIDKRSFLDHLMGDKSKSVEVGNQLVRNDTKTKDEPTWSVFRDDFRMGSNKMKDWDKQLEDDEVVNETEQMEVEQEIESD